jgi:hypothetical protein
MIASEISASLTIVIAMIAPIYKFPLKITDPGVPRRQYKYFDPGFIDVILFSAVKFSHHRQLDGLVIHW